MKNLLAITILTVCLASCSEKPANVETPVTSTAPVETSVVVTSTPTIDVCETTTATTVPTSTMTTKK